MKAVYATIGILTGAALASMITGSASATPVAGGQATSTTKVSGYVMEDRGTTLVLCGKRNGGTTGYTLCTTYVDGTGCDNTKGSYISGYATGRPGFFAKRFTFGKP
jgi:hypothetical protein